VEGVLSACRASKAGVASRGASLSLSADIHLTVLDNSYDRIYI
jgi:hypothetical protein